MKTTKQGNRSHFSPPILYHQHPAASEKSNPLTGDVVSGTGGLRKVRFGSEQEGTRGANRIYYAYFPKDYIVLMIMAYGKNRRADISAEALQLIHLFAAHC